MNEHWLAAAVELDITPPIGTLMDGYSARNGPSIGVHDRLSAQLLVIRSGNGGPGIIVVTLDLLGVGLAWTREVRATIAESIGIPADSILISCVHTHGGPAGISPAEAGLRAPADEALQEHLARQICGAAQWALRELRPARLSLGRAKVSDVGANRILPNGPADPELLVLRVDVPGESDPLAVMVNYGCHPTVMGAENRLITADLAGAARVTLRQIYPGTIVLYSNGASGDVSTRFTRREQTFDEVRRLGLIVAAQTIHALQTATPLQGTDLRGETLPVTLPMRPLPSLGEAEANLARLEADLAALKQCGAPESQLRQAITRAQGARAQVSLARHDGFMTDRRTEVQVVVVGEAALVALPGEPFTETVLKIKAESPREWTAVMSYANDNQGYFPDSRSIEVGSYESLKSFFDARAGALLADASLAMLKGDAGGISAPVSPGECS